MHELKQDEAARARGDGTGASLLQGLFEKEARPFTKDERKLMLDTCCSGATQKEADELIAIAEARGLSPIEGTCFFVKRWDFAKGREVWAVQTSIDGMRMKAEESGVYDGQDEPEYEHDPAGKLVLARVRVYRKGWSRPAVGVARFAEYVQKKKDGSPTRFWKDMPYNQLAKCAEALAFRKAFPKRFARIYTPDEMAQAENEAHEAAPDRQPAAPVTHDPETGEVRESKPGAAIAASVWTVRIEQAQTLDELRGVATAIGAEVKARKLTAKQADALRVVANARKAEIVSRQKAGPQVVTLPGEEPADSPPPDDAPLGEDDDELGGRL